PQDGQGADAPCDPDLALVAGAPSDERPPERRGRRDDLHVAVEARAPARGRDEEREGALVFFDRDQRPEDDAGRPARGLEREGPRLRDLGPELQDTHRLTARDVRLLERPRVLVVLGTGLLMGGGGLGLALRALRHLEVGGEQLEELLLEPTLA